ncbi:hypothetical protein G9U51_10090 [Calidifontibacter sp. DB0510]|uniref:Endonuclease/exonuclease/phosphatase domain-containing protein n=1 Tax=Metallococcus carri TaxID=1656884 RepID=A0A967B7F4_9MICO|nr:endonuclease/exonuclease/phosphatase family protein [Metallococcus carri]NHN56126.1 hypothetical protein [Metallococcus carri]NOP37417.1 hypothetical protein [Calidifontibacter sp. DB2511S]
MKRGGRRAAEMVVAGLTVIVALLIATRWVDRTGRMPQLQSVFPVFGIAAGVLVAVAAALRSWRLCAATLVVALVPGTLAVRALVPDTVAANASDDVVVAVNMEVGAADAGRIVRLLRERRATILVLTECTPGALKRLEAAGLSDILPQQAGVAGPDIGGTIVRSTHRLTLRAANPGEPYPGGRFGDSPEVVVHAARDVTVRAVHPAAPVPELADRWRADLAALASWRRAQPGGIPLLMVGDFNASSAMPAYRAVADTMTDAHAAAGAGWVRTWPQGRAYPPFVQLDHVLTRDLGVVAAGTDAVPSTDHRAVWARIRVK